MVNVTLADLARHLDLHVSTISRSLDPARAGRVNAATRARVLAAAAELGYTGHQIAGSLRRGRSSTVGIVVPDLSNPFVHPVIRGVVAALDRRGFMGFVAESGDDHAQLRRILEHLVSRRVDAIITSAARSGDAAMLKGVARAGTPLVLVARYLPDSGLPWVTHDDHRGGELAAEHLLDLGHVRLAQLRGPADVQTFLDRGAGFADVLQRRGLAPAAEFDSASAGTPSVEEGRRLMGRLLDRGGDRPTAVFAHNDLMAIGALEALAERGLCCPLDVSVMGYNDNTLTEHLNPPLSTVHLPTREAGRLAGEMALALIDEPGSRPSPIRLEPTLIARRSIAPPTPAGDAAASTVGRPASRRAG